MKLPWRKADPPIDLQAVVEQAATTAAVRAATAAVDEVKRAMIAVSPMPGAPEPMESLTQKSPYPLYAFNNPWQFFTPQAPTKRPQSLVTIDDLRIFADRYDVLRACIQHLKREVSAVPIQIVPREEKQGQSDAGKARIKDAQTFFETRGGLGGFGRLRAEFEGMVIEDLCVVGQAAVYFSNTRGGQLLEALPVDAATIRPRVDAYGWPGPGEVAFEQWVYGLKTGSGFTRDQMSFTGLATHARSYSPYSASPVEWLIFAILSALKADEWNRTWLTDGTTPADWMALPEGWTPAQIREWAEFQASMYSGDTVARQKERWVPGGTQKVGNPTRKDQEFQEFELWLLRRTCAVMGVQPASVGFAGEQYKVSQQDSMESTSAFGVGVLLDHRKAQYDDVLERLGYCDLECVNVTAREEKASERADRLQTLVSIGAYKPNEARIEEGKEPYEGGDEPLISTTLQPLKVALAPPEPSAPTPGGQPNAKPKPAPKSAAKDAAKDAARADLAKWETKVLNRLKDGRSPDCGFESDDIPEPLRRLVALALPGQTDAQKVRALFRHAGEQLEPLGDDTLEA